MTDAPEAAPAATDNPLHAPAFRRVWAARTMAVFATQAQGATLAWHVYAVARERGASVPQSAFYLSLIGLCQFLPMFILTLPAGELADRADRKQVMAASIAVAGLCSLIFLGLSFWRGAPLWMLFTVAGLFGATRTYLAPASQALLPMLVPRSALPRAIVMNALAFQVGAIAGPAIGGMLTAVSASFAYGVSLVLFAVSTVMIATLGVDSRPPPNPGSRWKLIQEGIAYVRSNKIVLGAISLDLAAVLLGGATLLVPVFARDVLHVNAVGFGVLRAATAVGAMSMALVLSRWSLERHAGLCMFAAVAVFGAATVVFGLSTWFWLSAGALAVLGAADMISVNVRQTLIQITTPDVMRGRVSAVSTLFVGASNELGEFESGLVARLLGAVGAAVFGGLGSLAVTGLWAVWFPALRKADRMV